MQGFLIVLVATAILFTYAAVKTAHTRLTHHGAAIGIVRYLLGHHWSGRPMTNATFLRDAKGDHAAPRMYHRAGWKRLLRRSGPVFGLIFAGIGYMVNPAATIAGIIAAAVAGAAFATWRAVKAVKRHRHRMAWVYPTHIALASEVGYSVADRPERWLQVEPDRSKATLALPVGCNYDDRQKRAIVQAASEKLALESPEAKWTLHGQTPSLILKASVPPPSAVRWSQLQGHVEQARADQLVLGIGRRDTVVKPSLAGDSPHVALSMGSGAGKSALARLLLMQVLNRGGVGLVLDPKLISLQWARGLPNVAYAATPVELHQALLWLETEVDRRNAVALASADVDGVVHANVGPRLLVVFEEMNLGLSRLRAYWRQSGGKGRSPALEAWESVLCAGRQVNVNAVAIAQMLSTRASGSSESRENLGTRILGRYTANAAKMLAPDFTLPPASRQPGRVQVVTDSVQECQTGFVKPSEARQFALAGTMTPCPAGMPFKGVSAPSEMAIEAPRDLGDVIPGGGDVSALPAGAVTLREAVQAGVVGRSLAAVRKARHRDPGFPEPVAEADGAHYYDPAALAAWDGREVAA